MMICGRNTMTLPTPEITPFCRKLCSRPAGRVSCTNCPSAAKASDNSSISGCAQANTAWNITNRISARIASPADRVQHHGIDPRRSRCRAWPAG